MDVFIIIVNVTLPQTLVLILQMEILQFHSVMESRIQMVTFVQLMLIQMLLADRELVLIQQLLVSKLI